MQPLFRLLIFLNQPYMFSATNSPILRSTFWLCIQLLIQCTDTAADRYHGWDGNDVPKAVYTVKKCPWGWANLSPETCRADLKRLIKEKVVAYYWLFTSLHLIPVCPSPTDISPIISTQRTSIHTHVWISARGSRSLDYPHITEEILGWHGKSSIQQDKDSFLPAICT